ncbi:hypothetical protein O3M35_003276 [Rhynocoris fuscipes]|uniref:Uncharacterized protein n=1 Tax=Rhynocoris fuscipes TaxID=488301 RepID=A0AAW1CMI1_9HEMI
MDSEVAALRKELESTKKALKVQTARCRNLVAAFTKRLAEKDAEVRSCRETREKQLSSLLRALLVLEARLKREQKNIKDMLAEKDNIINDQKLEIERLKTQVKLQEIPVELSREEVKDMSMVVETDLRCSPNPQPAREVYAKPDLISSLSITVKEECGPDSLSSDTASTKSCMGDESDYATPGPQIKGVLNIHNRSAFSPINRNKNDQRVIYSAVPHSVPDVSKPLLPEDPANIKPSALLQEIRIGNRPDEYRDNPVLQCVNQILLKDQEDFLEEQRSLRMKDSAWLDEEDSPVDEEEVIIAEIRPETPDEKSIEEDKEDLETSSKMSVTMADLNKNKMAPRLNPPLPPKPKLNGTKRVEFADIKPTSVQFHNPPMVLPPPQAIDSAQLGLPLSILGPVDQGQDNELYVISNSALDDDIVKQLRGRTLNVSGLHIKPQRISTDRNQHSNVPTGLLHPSHKAHSKSVVPYTAPSHHVHTPPANILKVNIQESPKRNSFGFKSPPKVGMPNMIKVASPVATLLTTASGQQEQSTKEEVSPSVSQMVRRFEEINVKKSPVDDNDVKCEEITTDVESNSPADTSVSYDNFLEATGLSQKSIMTPSRMMTNHRNVVKPKDVKLRSKVKAAGVIERCIPPQVVGPTIKYWTEPFL